MADLPKAELERLPTDFFNTSTVEHLHRYTLAAQLCHGRDVLDIASGEGYGSNLLAQSARYVVGVDIAADAVANARSKYPAANLEFIQAAAHAIPLAGASIDVAVSFETLEHHDRHREMMTELKRILRPGGLLIISTPEKHYYSDVPGYKNIYHVKELYLTEFRELVSTFFVRHIMLYQAVCYGTFIAPEHGWGGLSYFEGDFDACTSARHLPRPEYNIAIASDGELPDIGASFFDGIRALRDNRRQDWESAPRLERQLLGQQRVMEDLMRSPAFRLGRALTWPLRKLLRR